MLSKRYESTEVDRRTSNVLEAFETCNPAAVMEIQNASTTPSKSNQLRNVNTVRWKSQSGEIDDSKSEVIAYVNAGMTIIIHNFYIKIKERSFFVWSICYVQLFRLVYIRNTWVIQ